MNPFYVKLVDDIVSVAQLLTLLALAWMIMPHLPSVLPYLRSIQVDHDRFVIKLAPSKKAKADGKIKAEERLSIDPSGSQTVGSPVFRATIPTLTASRAR